MFSVNHNSGLNRHSNQTVLALIESVPVVLSVMRTDETNEAPTTCGEPLHHHSRTAMKLYRKNVQGVNLPGSAKLLDSELLDDRPKHLTIEIEVLALKLKIFHALVGRFLFTHVVPETPWLTASRAGRHDVAVCFEERPEEVVSNFALLEEWKETLSGGHITVLDGVHQ